MYCRRNMPKGYDGYLYTGSSGKNISPNDTCPFWHSSMNIIKQMNKSLRKVNFTNSVFDIESLTLKEIKKIVGKENGNG